MLEHRQSLKRPPESLSNSSNGDNDKLSSSIEIEESSSLKHQKFDTSSSLNRSALSNIGNVISSIAPQKKEKTHGRRRRRKSGKKKEKKASNSSSSLSFDIQQQQPSIPPRHIVHEDDEKSIVEAPAAAAASSARSTTISSQSQAQLAADKPNERV